MDASLLSTLHCDLAAQLGKTSFFFNMCYTAVVDQKKLKLHFMGKEEDLAVALSKLVEDAENFNIHRFKCALEIKIKEMEASIKQQEKVALQESLHFEQCKKEMEDYRQQLAAATRAAESVTVITPALEHEFLQMPYTIEDLNAAIHDISSQANLILFLNHNIWKNMNDVVELLVKLESIEQELIACLEELSSLKMNLETILIAMVFKRRRLRFISLLMVAVQIRLSGGDTKQPQDKVMMLCHAADLFFGRRKLAAHGWTTLTDGYRSDWHGVQEIKPSAYQRSLQHN
ncbi:hypothetical protein E3N88_12238 [Mikania micrantha]|uniref:Uncharacterized protein n=1 Tax=Mikania micrantha TaxID=192012 RepID=A0A5N6P533_9ASTR|nr:hypothetical protein E3N88_12238 [Mikania micrantha]